MAPNPIEEQVQKNIDERIEQIQKKFARNIWILFLLLGGSGGALVGTGSLQSFIAPDRYTGTQGRAVEARVTKLERAQFIEKQECASYREGVKHSLDAMEWRIRKDMPPGATKARIKSIERFLEKAFPDFSPATQDWQ